jgi:hypothetical protein
VAGVLAAAGGALVFVAVTVDDPQPVSDMPMMAAITARNPGLIGQP